jgi:hypothetical protein
MGEFGMVNIAWIVLASSLALAWPNPTLGQSSFVSVEKKASDLARNKRMAIVTIGLTTILVRVLLLAWIPIPKPTIHDEYSYLLAADTFLHGRLSNPSHPLWLFFDTFHVIHSPTYASIYPPAQGAILAIGKLLGHPWIGVLLSTAAMCAAITWMLQGWMPARWALLGGTLVLLKIGIASYWMNSYWGGSVIAVGAALVMGAYPRIKRISKIHHRSDVWIMGLGMAILATSRPLEGFIFCLPVAVAIIWSGLRRDQPGGNSGARKAILPLAAMLACLAGFVAFYNWSVTKSPMVFPHFVEERDYITSPVFVWEHSKPAHKYSNPQFDAFYNSVLPSLYSTTWKDLKRISVEKAKEFWKFFLGPVLSFSFLAMPWLLFDRKMRLVLVQFGLSAVGLLSVVWFHPHYAAPLTASVALLVTQGLRHLHTWKFGRRRIGNSLVRMIVLFSLMIPVISLVSFRFPGFAEYWTSDWELGIPKYVLLLVITFLFLFLLRIMQSNAAQAEGGKRPVPSSYEFAALVLVVWMACLGLKSYLPYEISSPSSPRASIEQRLDKLPGDHLILVKYSPKHNVHQEYVYNDADIDHSKIVWAREIPGQEINLLLTHFRNRDVWVLEPDEKPVRLYRYTAQAPVNQAFQNSPGN